MEFYMPAPTAEDLAELWEAHVFAITPPSRHFIRKRGGRIFSLAVFLFGIAYTFTIPSIGTFSQLTTHIIRVLCVCGLSQWCFSLIYFSITRRQSVQKALAKSIASWISINETGISIRKEDDSYQMRFAWGMVEKMIISENLYVLLMQNNVAVSFSRWLAPPELDMRQLAQSRFPQAMVMEIKTELKRKTPPFGTVKKRQAVYVAAPPQRRE